MTTPPTSPPCTAGRDRTAIECDPLFAAMRRPELRPIAGRMTRASESAIARCTDPLTARTAAAVDMGMTAPDPPGVDEVTAVLNRLLGTAGAGTTNAASDRAAEV
ncbi:hypothetical protein [Nocardia sp. NPDC127526]|uniref:hypothetical protein n=1 Tax=Nocardia sp. NPDC127526 TaxID=3345393 RepID=UPI00363A5541